METIDFKQNNTGKFFLDFFGHVMLADPSFTPGREFKATFKGQPLGTIRVVSTRSFRFIQISDNLSFIETGHPAHYLAALIKKQAEEDNIRVLADTQLSHVIFHYTHRNIELHAFHMKEWWQAIIDLQKPTP